MGGFLNAPITWKLRRRTGKHLLEHEEEQSMFLDVEDDPKLQKIIDNSSTFQEVVHKYFSSKTKEDIIEQVTLSEYGCKKMIEINLKKHAKFNLRRFHRRINGIKLGNYKKKSTT